MNEFFNKYKYFIFFVLLSFVYIILDYHSILFYRPQGIHFIRQTDSLSFVANYFNNGTNFFEPQVFNLSSIEGRATSEFPILYYVTSLFYKLFDEQEFILRLITVTIVSFGFFSLFKLLILLLKDIFYAFIFSFLFLSSTVLLYYTNNYLPDASALGFTLAGWYYFFLSEKQDKKYLIITFSLFTISSLLKATYFINPISAILTILIVDLLKKDNLIHTIKSNSKALIAFLVATLLLISWNIFVISYNATNQDTYFLVTTRPIWNMSLHQIIEIWDYVSNYWFSKYYFQSTIHFFVIVCILGTIFSSKANKTILIPSIFLLIGSTFYLLLFFAQFKDHDYYFITLIPTIILLVINGFTTIRNKFPKVLNNYIAKILLLSLTVLSMKYASTKLEGRYNFDDDFSKISIVLSDARTYIDTQEISKDAKFIVFTDKSPNGGLYFLNRKGWNIKDTSELNIKKINEYKRLGADYLVNTTSINFNYPVIWSKNNVSILKVK